MVIKINYTSNDVYVSTSVSPVYVVVNYSAVNNGGGAVWGGITGTLSDQTDLQDALDDKVPYTGATENVDLGEYELKAGQMTLDVSPTGTAAVGTTRWNNTIGSSETTLKGGSVILKNGVDLVARIVNKVTPNTTLTKAAYQAVRVSGAQGQRLAVAFAQANNDANSADTIGLVTETIATNQEGFIITVGQLENINTTGSLQGETWVDGDVLYLSPTTPGAITKVKPTGAGHIVVIGYVEYAHANNGKIYVKVMNGWELDELHDVSITSVANNEALIYESSSQLWKNKTIASALGYTPVPTTRTLTINGTSFDLSADRSWTIAAGITGSGATGQVAYWNGTNSQTGSNNLFWDAANSRLGIGTNTPTHKLQVIGNFGSYSTGLYVENTGSASDANKNVAAFIGARGNASVIDDNTNIGIIQKSTIVGNLGLINFYNATFNLSAFLGVEYNNHGNTNNGNLIFGTALSIKAKLFNTGNLVLQNGGTFTDGGQRLQVMGDARISNILYALGGIVVGADGSGGIIRASATNAANLRFTIGGSSLLGAYGAGIANSAFLFTYPISTNTDAATHSLWGIVHSFAPTSGTTGYIMAGLQPTINQTGGANGITRGLYVNPTLTAAADWRSIEWSNNSGWGLYGAGIANNYLGGKLVIGTTTVSTFLLDVNGTARVSGNTTISLNQNAKTELTISNTTSGTNSSAAVTITSTNGGLQLSKYSPLTTAYKIISGGDSYVYNYTGGDIAILNDFATGTIKLAAGGSSTAQMTLTSNGNLLLNTNLPSRHTSSSFPAIFVANTNSGIFGETTSGYKGINLNANIVRDTSLFWTCQDTTQPGWLMGLNYETANADEFVLNRTAATSGTASFVKLFSVKGNGYVSIGLDTTAATALTDIGASTTARASLRLRSGTAPTSPNNGDIWFDGTDLKMRIGGVTKTFTLV